MWRQLYFNSMLLCMMEDATYFSSSPQHVSISLVYIHHLYNTSCTHAMHAQATYTGIAMKKIASIIVSVDSHRTEAYFEHN